MYDVLYADAKLWLNKGWLDYVSPQLYWKIGGPQDYVALLKWWVSQNTAGRHVWPGLSAGRHPPAEMLAQVDLTRHMPGTTPGVIFWSSSALFKRQELTDALAKGPYAEPALIPASPWLGQAAPPAPKAAVRKGSAANVTVVLSPADGKAPAVYAVWVRRGEAWSFLTTPGAVPKVTLGAGPGGAAVSAVVVTAVDRLGNESPRVTVPVR
jgi:hypothetical protein